MSLPLRGHSSPKIVGYRDLLSLRALSSAVLQVIDSCSSTALRIWGVTENRVQNIFFYLFHLWASG